MSAPTFGNAPDVPLLRTKLHIPSLPSDPARPHRKRLVPRPRLAERLNAGLHQKLTLLSAPPGFGKTTLLSQWIHQRGEVGLPLGVAWLSLDEADNDPARFLSYLVAALQTLHPSIGKAALTALRSPQPPPVEAVLTALINEIAALLGEPDVADSPPVLVLDDYHAIAAQSIHQAVTFLLDHLPSPPGGIHLIISTRADPPLMLSRLRGRGEILEVRVDDLRFTPAEATDLLNQVMDLGLSNEQVAGLELRTEGWVAGLQLAALALQAELTMKGRNRRQASQDARVFIEAFAGDDRYVADYLVEEVLQRQPESVQTFLLQTSILDRLCGPLCDALWFSHVERPDIPAETALAGQMGSQVMLEALERANLFVVPLDNKRVWYRYHQLFSDLLRHRLQQVHPDRVAVLHHRASEWYERNGLMYEAVGHAMAAQDLERAASLIEQTAWSLMAHGEMATILGWLKALPDDLVRQRPRLRLLQAWALLGVMQFEAIEQRLCEVEQSVRQDRMPMLIEVETQGILGEIAAIRATAVGMQGDMAAAIELCQEALDRLPEEEQHLRGTIANSLGAAYSAQGETLAASRALTEAVMLSQAAGNTLIALIALGNLAGQQEVQGQLRRAAETCRHALRLASEPEGPLSPAAGMAHVGLGRLLCEWGQLDDATRHLRDAIELGKQAGIMELVVSGFISLAGVHTARRDLLAASETLEEAVSLEQRHSISAGLSAVLAACQACLWVRQGQFDAAARWAQRSGLDTDDPSSHLRHDEYIVLARLLIALGKADKALDLLARLLQAAEHQGRMGHAVQVLVLQALAFQGQGKHDQAMDALARALVIGEPEDYLQTFVVEGAAMVELLQQAASRGIAVGYASRLLAALEATTKAQGPSKETHPLSAAHRPPSILVEPLSERELEVLRLIASGLSNREIAGELVITVGTAKWHLHNIYGKLGVHSRTQAVARARDLALL